MCKPAPPPPKYASDIGYMCGAGSNYALCLVDTTDSNCDTGYCLWDQKDPTGTQAYCTGSCTPGDATTCPPSFECKTESCNKKSVCVRTSQPPETQLRIEAHANTGATGLLSALGLDDNQRAHWGSAAGMVLRWNGSTFESLGTTILGRTFGAAVSGGVIYFDPNGNDEQLGSVRNGQVKVKTPNALVVSGLFAGENGSVYYFDSWSTPRFVPIDADLNDLPDYIPLWDLPLRPTSVHGLRSFGFFGRCTTDDITGVDCFSADGKAITQADGADASLSIDPSELWGVLATQSVAAKWDGKTWVAETELSARYPDIVAVFPIRGAPANHVLAFNSSTSTTDVIYLNGTCWQPLHDDIPDVDIGFDSNRGPDSLLQLDARSVAWIDIVTVKIVHLDSFSNY